MSNPNIAGAVLGGGFQLAGQYMANQTTREIAEMNNETMLQAMREQTKAEQDYNSQGEQMKRAMLAGINPMLLAGAQPTSASSASVPSLDSPTMANPFEGFSALGSSVSAQMLQARQLDNQEKQLDIVDFESTIELLRVVGDLAKSGNLSSEDINNLIKTFIRDDKQSSIAPLLQDEFVKTRLVNGIESSDLDLSEKRYLYGWLDKFTNARFSNLLAEGENLSASSEKLRSDVRVNDSTISLNETLKSLNEEKRKEVEQAISNMKEEWKSLNFQGELDVHKLKKVATISSTIVRDLVNNSKITENEANYWVWNILMETGNKSFLGFTNRLDASLGKISKPF